MPPDMDALRRITASVGTPVNALAAGAFASVPLAGFASAGVRRVSIGSALARVTHKAIIETTRAILDRGDFSQLGDGASGDDVDGLLTRGAADAP